MASNRYASETNPFRGMSKSTYKHIFMSLCISIIQKGKHMTHIPDAAVQAFIERYELGCNHRYDENSICAALPYLQPVAVAAVTRPVTNIESRTPKEVFDIMCDRIRALSAEPDLKGQQHDK